MRCNQSSDTTSLHVNAWQDSVLGEVANILLLCAMHYWLEEFSSKSYVTDNFQPQDCWAQLCLQRGQCRHQIPNVSYMSLKLNFVIWLTWTFSALKMELHLFQLAFMGLKNPTSHGCSTWVVCGGKQYRRIPSFLAHLAVSQVNMGRVPIQ